MKKRTIAAAAAALFLIIGAGVAGAGKSSVELGQEMFNDPALGNSTNG